MRNESIGKATHTKALLALTAICFLWGTTWVASKAGVTYMPALQLAGIRQLIAGLTYLVFFMVNGRAFPRGKQWRSVLILSLLNFFLSNALATWGVKYISSGLGAIIAAMFPLWLVIISVINGKSKLSFKTWLGFLLGFAGICIIFYDHLHDFLNPEFRFGIMLSVGATIAWTIATIYTKQEAATFNPYFSLGLQMLISGIALNIVTRLTGDHVPISQIPIQAWAAIAYLAIVGSVFAFLAYLYALQNLPTEQVTIYGYINPIVAVILGSILFGEKLNVMISIGGIIAILGVYLINQGYRKQVAEKSNQELASQ